MKKVIRDLPERNFNELNAAQRYLFGVMPVIGTSDMFTPVIMHMKMPRLPKLMSNKAEREALETTTLTQFVNFLKQKYNLIVEAIEQERNKTFQSFKGYTLTTPLPGEYVNKSPMSYDEFKQLCA